MLPRAAPAAYGGDVLSTWVVDVQHVTQNEGTFVHAPEVATALVVRNDDVLVAGPRTRGSYHPGKPVRRCVRMRLHPGRAHHLLGVPIDELADRIVPLADLWGAPARRLTERLAASTGVEPAMTALAEAIEARARTRSLRETHLVGAALRALTTGEGGRPPRLTAVADDVGVSERHLRTVFAREVGVSPKHYARLARIRGVIARTDRRTAWATMADEAGYFDQAHLINDFRSVMGITPAAFAAGKLPPPSPCATLHRLARPAAV